jgi:lysophospholipase L1-like esterase
MAPDPNGSSLRAVNNGLRNGADALDVPFIDVLSNGWLNAENSPGYAYEDGWHVNTAGHAYLATKIKEALDAAAAAS